jgi:hypothetical protein
MKIKYKDYEPVKRKHIKSIEIASGNDVSTIIFNLKRKYDNRVIKWEFISTPDFKDSSEIVAKEWLG